MIKRIDVGAFELAKHMISGGPSGQSVNLGLANGGFTYSTQGGGVTAEMTEVLDGFVDEITERARAIPVRASVQPLLLDLDGNEIDGPHPSCKTRSSPSTASTTTY